MPRPAPTRTPPSSTPTSADPAGPPPPSCSPAVKPPAAVPPTPSPWPTTSWTPSPYRHCGRPAGYGYATSTPTCSPQPLQGRRLGISVTVFGHCPHSSRSAASAKNPVASDLASAREPQETPTEIGPYG